MSKYTPEPWALHESESTASFGLYHGKKYIGIGTCQSRISYLPEDRANAARIVACVNACAGIEDPEATIPALNDLADKAIELTADVNIKEMVINQLKADKARLLNIVRVMKDVTANEPMMINTHRTLANILNEIQP